MPYVTYLNCLGISHVCLRVLLSTMFEHPCVWDIFTKYLSAKLNQILIQFDKERQECNKNAQNLKKK